MIPSLFFIILVSTFLPNSNSSYTDDCPMLPSSDGPFGNTPLPKYKCHDPECVASNFTGTDCIIQEKTHTLGSDWRDSATLRGEAATPYLD